MIIIKVENQLCFELTQYMEMNREVGSDDVKLFVSIVGYKISTPSSVCVRLTGRTTFKT